MKTEYKPKRKRWIGRKIALGFVVIFASFVAYVFPKWRRATNNGGQVAVKPFRIAGNLYYVGTHDVTSFLLTGPHGHILIDGGYPGTAPIIMKSIATLGFKITDVKLLLNSHAHFDHAGGLAALQKASGAQLWVSQAEAPAIATGGRNSRNMAPINMLVYMGLIKFPVPHINGFFNDGTRLSVGPVTVTAHITPGHTVGCTSWSFPVQDGGRQLLAVSIGSLSLPMPSSVFNWDYDKQTQQEFARSFATLRSLKADIFLASHASFFNLRRKMRERDTAVNPVTPFIDPEGYRQYINHAEDLLHRELKKQQAAQKKSSTPLRKYQSNISIDKKLNMVPALFQPGNPLYVGLASRK